VFLLCFLLLLPAHLSKCTWRSSSVVRLPAAAMFINKRNEINYLFQFIWESSFRREDILEINQSDTRIACGGHVC
jgi:hypothetical protein